MIKCISKQINILKVVTIGCNELIEPGKVWMVIANGK